MADAKITEEIITEQIDDEICEHNDCRRAIFVRSVPHAIRRKELTEFFSKFGPLSKVSIHTNCKTRKSKGTAQIQFLKLEDAENVLQLSDEQLKFRDRMLKPVPSRCQRVWKYKTSQEEVIAMTSSNIDVHESECYINTLPIELLSHIFSFLDYKERIRIENVCKLWRHLSSTIPWANMYSLVLRDSHFQQRQKLTSSILETILRRCGSTLKRLDLSMCDHQSLSLKFPIIIANHCPNLEEINLRGRKVSCKALGILAESCQKLNKIDLSRSTIGDKWVTKLLRFCKITELRLSHIMKLSGKSFHLLSNGIRVLDLSNCNNLFPGALDYICKHKTIEKLYLSNCNSLSQSSVQNMFKCLGASLTVLDMAGYFPELMPSDFMMGFANCPFLVELVLEANNFIDDSVIKVLGEKCPRLKSLNLNCVYITDKGILNLCKLDDLRHLFLNYNDKITEISLNELSLKGLLETLELRGCESITNTGINSILTNCKGIRILDVSSCPLISNDAFAHVLTSNWSDTATTSHLKIFAGGTDMTNFVNLPKLEISEINRCPRERRPWGMIYNYDENDDDWSFEVDYIDDDYDESYEDYDNYEDYDVDGWEFQYVYDQILDDPALYYDADEIPI